MGHLDTCPVVFTVVRTRNPSTSRSSAPSLNPAHRAIPITLGFLALGSIGLLLAWDTFPGQFPSRAHEVLGALPLGLIALAYLMYQALRRPGRWELVKATMLAAAFLSWAANQLWPLLPQATSLNDIAIALFVLDMVLVIMGWPPGSRDQAFAEANQRDDDDESDLTPDR
jgi:hypothetical protein